MASSKAIEEDRERFAKCFVISSEICKLWILKFAENRIQEDHEKTLIDFVILMTDLLNHKTVTEFLRRRKTSLSSEIEISALFVEIKTRKLLRFWELKSVGHQNNTTGDQIDRIREILYTLIHTAEPNLDESDYDDHINDFKDIGQRLEVINGEENGTYTKEIEEIQDKPFDTKEVEHIVVRYKLYVEMAIKEDRERFAKCFVIISENCKLWILKFVENRIQQDHGKTLIDFINSSADVLNDKIVTEFLRRRITSLSSEIEISELFVVIKTGKLLKPGELTSVGHQNNTTGDQIDRIREIRNTLIHTA